MHSLLPNCRDSHSLAVRPKRRLNAKTRRSQTLDVEIVIETRSLRSERLSRALAQSLKYGVKYLNYGSLASLWLWLWPGSGLALTLA
ncbi:hypothetical protein AWZ03_007766 [Drosophila navojoa]|uniref:Uncharacterized protein n=1 Tax=Drosophila navojoa TaxID=7232 RepID=A0A484BDE2_DRONA|nr:hypothetical protein AWZ03_007766 [Drosophila navojoa]